MKFMVMVNNKFMVSVEAESNCGAEHRILDEIYDGMQSALAFDKESMKTDHFRGCLLGCETISFSELKNMSVAYRDQWEQYSSFSKAIEEAEAIEEDLKKRLAECQETLRHAKQARLDAEYLAHQKMELLGMRRD